MTVSEKADVSIKVYGLNRHLLVQARQEVLKSLDFSIRMISDDIEDMDATSNQAAKQRLRKRINLRMADLKTIYGPEHQFTLMVNQKIEAFKSGN